MKLFFLFLVLIGALLIQLVSLKYSECATKLNSRPSLSKREETVSDSRKVPYLNTPSHHTSYPSRHGLFFPSILRRSKRWVTLDQTKWSEILKYYVFVFLDNYIFCIIFSSIFYIVMLWKSGELGNTFMKLEKLIDFAKTVTGFSIMFSIVSLLLNNVFNSAVDYPKFDSWPKIESDLPPAETEVSSPLPPSKDVEKEVEEKPGKLLFNEEKRGNIINGKVPRIEYVKLELKAIKDDPLFALPEPEIKSLLNPSTTSQQKDTESIEYLLRPLKSVADIVLETSVDQWAPIISQDLINHVITTVYHLKTAIELIWNYGAKDHLKLYEGRETTLYMRSLECHKKFFYFGFAVFRYIELNIAEIEDLWIREFKSATLAKNSWPEYLPEAYSRLLQFRYFLAAVLISGEKTYEDQVKLIEKENKRSDRTEAPINIEVRKIRDLSNVYDEWIGPNGKFKLIGNYLLSEAKYRDAFRSMNSVVTLMTSAFSLDMKVVSKFEPGEHSVYIGISAAILSQTLFDVSEMRLIVATPLPDIIGLLQRSQDTNVMIYNNAKAYISQVRKIYSYIQTVWIPFQKFIVKKLYNWEENGKSYIWTPKTDELKRLKEYVKKLGEYAGRAQNLVELSGSKATAPFNLDVNSCDDELLCGLFINVQEGLKSLSDLFEEIEIRED